MAIGEFGEEERMGIVVVKVRMIEDRRNYVPSLLYGMTADGGKDRRWIGKRIM
jgi:hypothetical protein